MDVNNISIRDAMLMFAVWYVPTPSTLKHLILPTINPLKTKRRLLYLKTQFVAQYLLNPLKTKHRLLYLKTQSVPRSKHFSSRL